MFVDRLLLWLHIGLAIFTIGPLTAATMSTARYIRAEDANVLRFLYRTTRLYGLLSLLVLLVGAGMASRGDGFEQAWLSVSMTLFVVAEVLLFAIVHPDQRRALRRVEGGENGTTSAQRGRISALSGVVVVLWLVVLILMIWQP